MGKTASNLKWRAIEVLECRRDRDPLLQHDRWILKGGLTRKPRMIRAPSAEMRFANGTV
jgi:hypothetical protein